MKKIALCSSTQESIVTFANEITSSNVSFKDVVNQWLGSGGKVLRKRQRPLGFILPALEFLKKNHSDKLVVLFDIDTLLHAEAEQEIKKDYILVFILPDSKEKFSQEKFDKVLYGEYNNHLEKVADIIVDCSEPKKAVAQIKALLKK